MKKILLILASAIIPVLSYAQEENKCCKDETATVNEVPNLIPPEPLIEFLESEHQDCQKDSVSFYQYDIVANPDNIFEEVQSMCERQTPMGITIMFLGLLLLLSLVIFVIAYIVRLIIICISNNRNIKK